MSKHFILSPATLALIAGKSPNSNMVSICDGLDALGFQVGLNQPLRLAHYIAQIAHESARFLYDREIWDGKGAQARYDIRTDLGNTPERDGDGFKFRGRTGMQITGKYNTTEFHLWCRMRFAGNPDVEVPDFVANPDLMNTDPWEGIGPLWYWDTRNLNEFADEGNIEMVTRRINGGLNGYADRLELFDRAALVLLGYRPNSVRKYQDDRGGLAVDGESGPQTRRALHGDLASLPGIARPAVVTNIDVHAAFEDAQPEFTHQAVAASEAVAEPSAEAILAAIRDLVA